MVVGCSDNTDPAAITIGSQSELGESRLGRIRSAPAAGPEIEGTPSAPDTATSGNDGLIEACTQIDHQLIGHIENPTLIETSGLAAGQRTQDVLWAHNDSETTTRLHAVGLDGKALAVVDLPPIDRLARASGQRVDLEDVTITGGRIHLADTGDNLLQRDSARIFVFDEPEAVGPVGGETITTTIDEVDVIEIVYPDGPENVEAIVADPISGDLFLFTKNLPTDATAPSGLTRVYRAAPPGAGAGPDPGRVEAELVATVDLDNIVDRLADNSPTRAMVALIEATNTVTAADLSPSGQVLVLRTYATTLLFPRHSDQSVADALSNTPCEGPFRFEPQGEAVAVLADEIDGTVTFVTTSEGDHSPLYASTVKVPTLNDG